MPYVTCLLWHLPAKIFMIDLEFVTFENNDKCFPTYKQAYFNAFHGVGSKRVNYIFTPTWKKCKNVSELEQAYRSYFNSRLGVDTFDLKTRQTTKQLNLLEI